MEGKVIILILLAIAWAILFGLNMRTFLFQRTVHKIHLKTGIPSENLGALYPFSYIWTYHVSKLRWGVLIALFFFNWIVGVVCIVAQWIVPIILPEEDDYENMKKMRKEIKKKGEPYLSVLDPILEDFMDGMLNEHLKNNFPPNKPNK